MLYDWVNIDKLIHAQLFQFKYPEIRPTYDHGEKKVLNQVRKF